MMFEQFVWQADRMLAGDLVFRLQHYWHDDWELGDDCFIFYKTKPLVDQYAQFFHQRPQFHPQHMLELGLWEGGSIAFWYESLTPDKLIGIDIAQRHNSAYLTQYLQQRQLTERIHTHWGTSQDDAERLHEIVTAECNGYLDLVIDDASHLYALSKRSFEILFPLLRPGGLYIIEDWAWAHWQQFQLPSADWSPAAQLTQLVCELIQIVGTTPTLCANLSVFPGFVAIERGPLIIPATTSITLHQYIYRHGDVNAS